MAGLGSTNGACATRFTDLGWHPPAKPDDGVQTILRSVRSHLDMDVAFVAQFIGRQRFFRNVDAKVDPAPMTAGDAMSLSGGYCLDVVEGRLPELIVDTALVPAAVAIVETHTLPIGAHLGVPIRLKDGSVYGTLCCFSYRADRRLNERDLQFMRAFAEVAAFQIESIDETGALRAEKGHRIENALRQGMPTMHFQPKVSLADLHVVGLECLARFGAEPLRGPADWFAEARTVGLGAALELQAIGNAVHAIRSVDISASVALCLNTSPQTLVEHDLIQHLDGFALDRVILEITEHDHVDDYGVLVRALARLRNDGVRVAIDDAGAGYASMAHILNIEPDYIKLDISLTRSIDRDRKRRALAAALIEFGRQTDCEVVAEGVETFEELQALRSLGVHLAQGYYISPPVPLSAVEAVIARLGAR